VEAAGVGPASEKARHEEPTRRIRLEVFGGGRQNRREQPHQASLISTFGSALPRGLSTLLQSVFSQAKLPSYQGTERVWNLSVPWHWRGAVCRGIEVDFVPATGALQNATASLQFANEFTTLQAGTSMSFVWMAADVGEVCSSSISR
jgi:hypothetical protein